MLNEYKHISRLSNKVLSLFSLAEIKGLMENQLITSYSMNGKPYYYKPKELEEQLSQFIGEYHQLKPSVLPVFVPNEPNEIPFELSAISEKLVRLPAHFVSAVYFLCKNNKVVYVGQATIVARRVSDHIGVKDFDTVFYLPVPKDDLTTIELSFIESLYPELNKKKKKRTVTT